jgi:hypothetical protein
MVLFRVLEGYIYEFSLYNIGLFYHRITLCCTVKATLGAGVVEVFVVSCYVLRAFRHVMYDYDYMERSIGVQGSQCRIVCKVILLICCGFVQEKEERRLFKVKKDKFVGSKPKSLNHIKSMKCN